MMIFIRILFSFLILGSLGSLQVLAQSASILPPAKTTFFDANGNPLTSGTVTFYIPGTTTKKTTWQDADKKVSNTNPLTLDSAGRAIIYGDGSYRQIVKDKAGNTIWDANTASTGTGGSTTVTGDGDLVGTVKPWAGLTAPNQYQFAYGQEISRTTYSSLFTAITLSSSLTCTSGSPILSNLADTTQIPIGAPVEAACLSPGATVISKTVTTITVSSNAISSTVVTAVIFPWGNGNGLTTFNLPDLRGATLSGRDNMGGTASARLANGPNVGQRLALTPLSLPMVTKVTTQTFKTSGSGTYTTPSGATKITIKMVAAGGGGGAQATSNGAAGGNTCWKTSGAACSTPDFSAVGGSGGVAANGAGGAGGSGGSGSASIRFNGGNGSHAIAASSTVEFGGQGGESVGFSGGGVPRGSGSVVGTANTGGGGSGGASGSTTAGGAGGGAGEYVEFSITSPAATYTYAVGTGGAGGAAGTTAGGTGGDGLIIVTEEYSVTTSTNTLVATTTGTAEYTNTINIIIKVTPDTSAGIYDGVSALGGMTGAIACGDGLLCTGNVISSTAGTILPGTSGFVAYYPSTGTTIDDASTLFISGGTLTVGVANAITGTVALTGSTSGTVSINPAATAGTWSFTLPTSGGTANYLLSTDGSGVTSWVGFAQTYTGATTRSFLAKGRDSVSVKDFGALCDGVTDDLAAFNLAIANAINLNFRSVYVPAGVCVVSDSLTTITGFGWLEGEGPQTSFIKTTKATGDVVTINVGYSGVRDLGFQSSVTRTSGATIKLASGSNHSMVQNVAIDGAYHGITSAGVLNGILNTHISGLTSRAIAAGSCGVVNSGAVTLLKVVGTSVTSGTSVAADMAECGYQAVGGEIDMVNSFAFYVKYGIKANPPNGVLGVILNITDFWADSTLLCGICIMPDSGGSVTNVWIANSWMSAGYGATANSTGFSAVQVAGSAVGDIHMINNVFISYNTGTGTGLNLDIPVGTSFFQGSNLKIGFSGGAWATGFNVTAGTSYWTLGNSTVAYNTLGALIGVGADNYVLQANRFDGNITAITNNALGSATRYVCGNTNYAVCTIDLTQTGITGPLSGANGGTGVANTGKTITLGGNLTTSGAFATTFTMTGITAVTFPTSGTLATTAGASIPSLVQGDMLYASGTNTLAALAKGASGTILQGGTTPAWSTATYPSTAGTSGTLLRSNGTNLVNSSFTIVDTGTSGGIPYYSSTTAISSSALLTANAIVLGGGAGTTPATLGSLGTTTTVLHGNAAGAPTFGAVVSADLNITTTSCTNQFVTAISAGGVGTCTTDTLASAQHANQGTTTTVLHGNASGNPTWAAVSLTADVSGVLPGANGGTGLSTAAIGDIMYASATTPTWSRLADVATGSVLVSGGVNTAPAWSAAITVTTSVSTAALTGTTSITSPLHIGGSGTTGTQLTFQTTTGVGTTDAFAFKGGNNGATTFATLKTASFDIQSGSAYTINSTSVLNATTLGSGVTASSLTSLGTITTLTATTINAFTLGGDISGATKGINNIVIGASNPLAGTFTVATANSFVPNSSTVPANGMYLIGANNVGLAVNTTKILDIQTIGLLVTGRIRTTLYFEKGATGYAGTDFGMYSAGAGDWMRFVTNAGDFVWSSDNAAAVEIMHLTSGGALTVNGTTASTSKTTGSLINKGGFGNAGAIFTDTLSIITPASDAGKTDNTLCWDTTAGTVYKGSGALGVCLGTSSRRYKEDEAETLVGLREVLLLNPKTFRYKPGYGDDGLRVQYGFIAEDVVNSMPSHVYFDDKGRPNSVDMLGMMPVVVKAIQELKAANDNLRNELNELKTKYAQPRENLKRASNER